MDGTEQPDGTIKLVVTVPLDERHLARLRAYAPAVSVVVPTPEDLEAELADADALVAWRLTAEHLSAAPRLRWFQSGGAGVEDLPLSALRGRNVVVTNSSGVHAINIGEHTLAMMLAFARQLPTLVRDQAEGRWRDAFVRSRVFELHGQTLLLVGLGDLARGVADRAVGFGMTVVGVRRRPDLPAPANVAEVVGFDQLEEVLGRADHVVNCLPLTERTRGMFDGDRLARMKPGAFLYNVGRGGTIETAALVAALQSGHLGGAGLDVTDPEPLPPESPLWTMDNVLITAHTSGGTPRYWDRGLDILEENLRRFLAGEPLTNVVDVATGY